MKKKKVREISLVLATILAIILLLKVGIGTMLAVIITALILGVIISWIISNFIDEYKIDKSLKELNIPLDFTSLCVWVVGLLIAIPDLIKSFF